MGKSKPAPKPAPKPGPSSQRGMPSGKVGGYRAPVDTAGMDPDMKRTMGFGAKSPRRRAK